MPRIKTSMKVRNHEDRNQKDESWTDQVEWINFKKATFTLRFVGGFVILGRHWVHTKNGKLFPTWCPKFDSESESRDPSRPCPLCDDFNERIQKLAIANVIVRDFQNDGKPPVRGIQVPITVVNKMAEIALEMNDGIPLEDMENGMDVKIKYSPEGKGSDMYMVMHVKRTPLTEEEKALPFYNWEEIIPDYDNPEISVPMARELKRSLAVHRYYLQKRRELVPGESDPWEAFVPSDKGQPYTDFPEVVAFLEGKWPATGWNPSILMQGTTGEGSQKTSSAPLKSSAPSTPSPVSTPTEPPFTGAPKAESAPAPEGKPDCFGHFDANPKCMSCPYNSECVEAMSDDDF